MTSGVNDRLGTLPSALPALPNPSMLFHISSSLSNIREEILHGMSNIQSLREAVKAAGPDALPLPPLEEEFLLPLPAPPQPSHTHRPVAQKTSHKPGSSKPLERPDLLRKFEVDLTVDEILARFREAMSDEDKSKGFTVTAAEDHRTLHVSFAPGGSSSWLVLDGQSQNGGSQRVARVSVFGPSKLIPSVLALPTEEPYAAISKHLSSLSLNLHECLLRLLALPSLLKEPCFRCQRHLRLGIAPTVTGYLPASESGSNEPAAGSMLAQDGQWVIWHSTCTT